MTRRLFPAVAAALLILTACGKSAAGLDPEADLGDLDDSDVEALCEWTADIYGGVVGEYECEDGWTISYDEDDADVGTCVDDLSGFSACALSVAEYEGCLLAVEADPCAFLTGEECAPFWECAFGGS